MTVIGRLGPRRTAGAGQDAGFTLPELLITIILVGILGVLIGVVVSTLNRNALAASARINAATESQTILDRTTRYIRSTDVANGTTPNISTASASTMTFQSDLDNPTGPMQVTLALTNPGTANGTLTETLRPADSGSCATGTCTYTGASVTRTLGSGVNTVSKPLFTYYTPSNCAALTASEQSVNPAAAPSPLTVPMTGSATAGVGCVQLNLMVQGTGVSKPVTSTTLVYLRNIEY